MRGLNTILTTAALLGSTVLAANKAGVTVKDGNKRKECTVYPYGGNRSDVSNILSAFKQCGSGGMIIFPEKENYFIDQKLNPVVNDVTIEWRGIWTFSPDIDYWRLPQNHYPIAFQDHAASFVLTGDGINIDGYGTGGIFGNGDVWYTAEAGTTQCVTFVPLPSLAHADDASQTRPPNALCALERVLGDSQQLQDH